jgi:hypothetical protein
VPGDGGVMQVTAQLVVHFGQRTRRAPLNSDASTTTNDVIEYGSGSLSYRTTLMTWNQWLGIGSGLLLIAFLWFALRQGKRVKPGHEHPPSPYT